MAKPDFSLIWAFDRTIPPAQAPTSAQYRQGWQFRNGVPPLTINFDYYQNLSDLRSIWLSEQFPAGGTSAYMRNMMLYTTGAEWIASIGANNASIMTTGTLPPARLADSGISPGAYGTATQVPRVTFDAKGRAMSVVMQNIAFPAPPTSSEGVPGIVSPATQSDVDNGSNINRYVKPDVLLFGFELWISGSSGYITFPKWMKKFTIQWGINQSTANANTALTSNYHVAFATVSNAFAQYANGGATSSKADINLYDTTNNSFFRYNLSSNGIHSIRWWAVGVR